MKKNFKPEFDQNSSSNDNIFRRQKNMLNDISKTKRISTGPKKTKQNKNKNFHLLTNKLKEDEKDYNKLKRFIIQLQ